MAIVADPSGYAQQLNDAAGADVDPADRVAVLRRMREDILADLRAGSGDPRDLTTLLGQADRYIAANELAREALAMSGHFDRAQARENAEIRDALIAAGVTTADELDGAGWPSHAALDAAEADDSLTEAVVGMWKEVLHPRGSGGKFRSKPGMLPKPQPRGDAHVSGGAQAAEQVAKAAKKTAGPKKYEPSPAEREGIRKIDSLSSVAEQLKEVAKHALNDWPTKGEAAKRILGDAYDTRELHTVPVPASPGTEGAEPKRSYTAQRKVLHDQIIGDFLSGPIGQILGENHPVAQKLARGRTLSPEEKDLVRKAAADRRGGQRPKALFMAGGPASGKTSALKASPELEPDAAVLINPDDVKAKLPEYHAMVDGRDKYAANGVHEESSDLGKRLQSEAVGLGLNTVIDGTGDSKRGKFAGKMKDLDKAGYDVSALYVTIPTDTAVVRATRRAMGSGRWVPEPELRAQHKNVSANFPDVAELPFLRDLKVYDNSGDGDPVLIATAGAGKTSVLDQERYDTFLAKAREGEQLAEAQEGDTGEFAHDPQGEVPVADWIQWPVSDSAVYLDRPDPVYVEDDSGGSDEQ